MLTSFLFKILHWVGYVILFLNFILQFVLVVVGFVIDLLTESEVRLRLNLGLTIISLVDWFYGVLLWLGIWHKDAKILFLGLDNSGKTTLLHMLKEGKLVQHQPTQYPISEELSIGKTKFKAFDLGGHQIARRVWKDYYAKVDGVVYLVDANDKERFAESRNELNALLAEESLANVPFLILGNKIDNPYAASEEELRYHMGLSSLSCGKSSKVYVENSSVRPLEVFMCSIVRKMGYGDGFKWVSQYIK
ncbi:small COPII coat GTPase SAR1A-like [Rutidosis leptorrhynchoides]|uniref:small COPII coat GTPase SAR1A-like n=1 Tax=Rutidosis leptorrhynchoides TaxID=125765 RepID=UPI003A9930F0